jgi:hypothetical protein
MPSPAKPSRAGSRVIEASTITATTIAADAPMMVAAGIPATTSPPMAMMTVPPAKTTAWPAVALARPIESTAGALGEVLPVAGHDEQGVVDARAEPEHDPEEQAGEGTSTTAASSRISAGAGGEPEQREAERQPGRDDRPERDEHDHERSGDLEGQLGAAEVR